MEVEPPAVPVDVENLSAGVKPRDEPRFEGFGVKIFGEDAARRRLGVGKAGRAGHGEGPALEEGGQGGELLPGKAVRPAGKGGDARGFDGRLPQPPVDKPQQEVGKLRLRPGVDAAVEEGGEGLPVVFREEVEGNFRAGAPLFEQVGRGAGEL